MLILHFLELISLLLSHTLLLKFEGLVGLRKKVIIVTLLDESKLVLVFIIIGRFCSVDEIGSLLVSRQLVTRSFSTVWTLICHGRVHFTRIFVAYPFQVL